MLMETRNYFGTQFSRFSRVCRLNTEIITVFTSFIYIQATKPTGT